MRFQYLYIFIVLSISAFSQPTLPINLKPSLNIENFYFTGFNSQNATLEKIYFEVFCESDSIDYITPSFEVQLLLNPQNNLNLKNAYLIKTYSIKEISTFNIFSHEELEIHIPKDSLIAPVYEIILNVNSNKAFLEDSTDNIGTCKQLLYFDEDYVPQVNTIVINDFSEKLDEIDMKLIDSQGNNKSEYTIEEENELENNSSELNEVPTRRKRNKNKNN